MTVREQLEQRYGKKTTEPTSVRAKLQAKYGTKNDPLQNLANRKAFFPANTQTSNPLGNVARTVANIPSSAINLGRTIIADPINNFIESDKALFDIYKNRGAIEGTKDIVGGFASTLGGAGNLYKDVGEVAYGALEKGYNALLDDPKKALGDAATAVSKIGIEDPLLIPSVIYGGGKGIGRTDVISDLASPVTRGVDSSIPTIVKNTGNALANASKEARIANTASNVAKTADEIYAVEQNYAKGRNKNNYAKDGGAASRERIARSGVLNGATDADGKIITKNKGGAVENYRKQTIDGKEDVVKKDLEREGASINLKELARRMEAEMYKSAGEGEDLFTALNKLKKEIRGLALKADQSGNIPLAKLQDAKISTTRNINYLTPPETQTYRKALARVYKTAIEDKSKLNIREINSELQKHYDDLERLENLDGKKVKGGRLGRYAAQVTGNIVGGIAGAPLGAGAAAVSSVVGGEVAAGMRGAQMAGSFGKVRATDNLLPPSKILEDAKIRAESPKVRDLETPDPVVGVLGGVPKTKEIVAIESQIKNNVKQQKAAIKAGDVPLVVKLKEIYDELVATLKKVVEELLKEGPPMRGFIRIGSEPKGAGASLPKSSKQSTSPKSTTKATESQAFKGFNDLSTKLLERFKGRSTVSKEELMNATNWPDLKQPERDLIRRVLDDMNPKKADGYTMSHRPSEGVRAFNLTEKVNGEEMIPKDMYEKWYGSRGTVADKESIAVLKAIKDKPEANVTIYRASPKPDFNDGDWVSLSKEYAREHAAGNGTKVHSKVVKAKDLKWAMDDVNEFGYYPEKSDTINVTDFANRVKSELLPLKAKKHKNLNEEFGGYEGTTLPEELRGPVYEYNEKVYESPIKTSAGSVHSGLPKTDSYFAHSRYEDLANGFDEFGQPDKAGNTRRVIEIQSDLFQKGRLEQELPHSSFRGGKNIEATTQDVNARVANGTMTRKEADDFIEMEKRAYEKVASRDKELDKLEPYRNTWHERVIREEVKQAAKDGKTKLQFPTGETAMKIEGLGDTRDWYEIRPRLEGETTGEYLRSTQLTPEKLKVGGTIEGNNNEWIITDVLGDGKFKAIQKSQYDNFIEDGISAEKIKEMDSWNETFDISGKVDTENPIYKFYDKTVAKYLTNKYGGKVVTDPQGVKWVEIDIKPEYKKLPVEAFGALAAVGLGATVNK